MIDQLAGIRMMGKRKRARWVNNSGEGMDWMIDKMADGAVWRDLLLVRFN